MSVNDTVAYAGSLATLPEQALRALLQGIDRQLETIYDEKSELSISRWAHEAVVPTVSCCVVLYALHIYHLSRSK